MSLFFSTKKLNGVPLAVEGSAKPNEIYDLLKDSADRYVAAYSADDAAIKLTARCILFTGGTMHFFDDQGRDDLKQFIEQLRGIGADIVIYTSSDVFATAAVAEQQLAADKGVSDFSSLDANVNFMKDHLEHIGQSIDDSFDDDDDSED